MKVDFNGTSIETQHSSLFSLLEERRIAEKQGIAVAVNNEVILKSGWNSYELSENDKILVITAAAGG